MSNFDFVNFSPSTNTPAAGIMESRNFLMLLPLYNVMICLLGGVQLDNFSHIWRRTCTAPLPVKDCISDLWPSSYEGS